MFPARVGYSREETDYGQLGDSERGYTGRKAREGVQYSTGLLLVAEHGEVASVSSLYGCYREAKHDVAAYLHDASAW